MFNVKNRYTIKVRLYFGRRLTLVDPGTGLVLVLITPPAVPQVSLNTVASGGNEDTGLRCCLSHTAPGTAIGAPSLPVVTDCACCGILFVIRPTVEQK